MDVDIIPVAKTKILFCLAYHTEKKPKITATISKPTSIVS